MKLSVPHSAIERVLYALHRADVPHLLLQRTGPGWIIEMLRPPGVDVDQLVALGAVDLG